MPNVLVYSEIPEASLELVTAGSKLSPGQISVAVLGSSGHETDERINKVSVSGVSKIYEIVHDSLQNPTAESVVDALGAIYDESKPDFVLLTSTKRGKEVAPRLATRLNVGCITDASSLQASSSSSSSSNAKVSADRLVWGGSAIATVTSKGKTVLTIPLRAFERAAGESEPEVKRVDFEPSKARVRIIEKKAKPKGQVSIKDADAVVSAGRGFKKKEDLSMLDDLASVLNGVVGASRPLTSDLGWVPEDRQVGLSGVSVKPKLYVAVGISGQIQHLTGMRDSKLVVAINSDKNAPIFQECDYGIVGDLYAVVPQLTKALKSQLGR